MSRRLKWKLPEFLASHDLKAKDLRKNMLGTGPNVAYDWASASQPPERIYAHVLQAVLEALERLTGKPVALTDVMDWEEVDSPK